MLQQHSVRRKEVIGLFNYKYVQTDVSISEILRVLGESYEISFSEIGEEAPILL